jgi:long-chain fatty acid transport protein
MSGLSWNPAIMTQFPGRRTQVNMTYLKANAAYTLTSPATVTPGGGIFVPITLAGGSDLGSGAIGLNGALIPATYNVWQITDQIFLGFGNTAPFGLRSKPANQFFAGQVYGRSASIRTVNLAPSIAYKVNDFISVGAALQVQYAHVDLKQALGVTAAAPVQQLRGDSYDFGYRIGVTLTPFKGTTIGLAYRSGIDQRIKGFGHNPITGVTPVSVNLPLPGSVVFGLSQVINEQWQAHLGVEWTNWSRFNRLPVINRNTGAGYVAVPGTAPVSLNFEYKDSWYFAGAVEYKYNQALTLRAGLGYELSAIDDRNRTIFVSDNDRLWLSAGLSYQFSDKIAFDLGYTFITVQKARLNYSGAHPQQGPVRFTAEASPNIHIVSAALTYRWDDPKVAEPAAMIRKY